MGRRSGKSWMAAHEIMPWLLTPNTRGWIVGPNYALAQKIAREVKRMVMTQLKLPLETKKEINEGYSQHRYLYVEKKSLTNTLI